MAVRLRFSISGPRHSRIFHLVAVNQHARRGAAPIETLAIYDPQLKSGETHKTVRWSTDRIKYWLRNGAEPTDSVVKLLTLVSPSCVPNISISHPFAGWYPYSQLKIPQAVYKYPQRCGITKLRVALARSKPDAVHYSNIRKDLGERTHNRSELEKTGPLTCWGVAHESVWRNAPFNIYSPLHPCTNYVTSYLTSAFYSWQCSLHILLYYSLGSNTFTTSSCSAICASSRAVKPSES